MKININKKAIAVLLSGALAVGGVKFCSAKIKNARICDITSTPIESVLEDENVRKITTLDEEVAAGNINIIEEDREFRYHASQLTSELYENDRLSYDYHLNWLRNNYERIALDILFASAKCSIADELETDMDSITLRPGIVEDFEPYTRGFVIDSSEDKTYPVKADALGDAIGKILNIQSSEDFDINNCSAEEIAELYDNIINIANNATKAGVSLNNDELVQKHLTK